MVSVPAEGAERLSEILREIFALSEPNRPNRSKSTAADDSIELLDTKCLNGIHQTCCLPHRKQTSAERSEPEDHDCHR
jgi:hypothetical protein